MSREQAAVLSYWYLSAIFRRHIICPCQYFDRMSYIDGQPVLRHSLTELQHAARIPCGNELRLHGNQMRHLPVEERLRGLRMEEVVNASTPATPIAFRDFQEL